MSSVVFDHVRIRIGKEKCMMSYQPGEVILKSVFKEVGKETFMERFVNNEPAPLGDFNIGIDEALMAFLYAKLNPENCSINLFEWELSQITNDEAIAIWSALPMGSILCGRIRAKKLIFGHSCFKQFEQNVVDICDKDYLIAIDKRSVAPNATSAVPVCSFDTFHPNYLNGITMRFSRICLESESIEKVRNHLVNVVMYEKPNHYVTYRAPHGNPRDLFDMCKSSAQELHGRLLKRQIIGPVVLRHNYNSCGYWITAIRRLREKSVDWKLETCGLGEFCTKCTGSFEHDSFMNLPRRLVEEPEWTDVFCTIVDKKKRNAYFKTLTELLQNSEPVKTGTSGAEGETELADRMSSIKISGAEGAEEAEKAN